MKKEEQIFERMKALEERVEELEERLLKIEMEECTICRKRIGGEVDEQEIRKMETPCR